MKLHLLSHQRENATFRTSSAGPFSSLYFFLAFSTWYLFYWYFQPKYWVLSIMPAKIISFPCLPPAYKIKSEQFIAKRLLQIQPSTIPPATHATYSQAILDSSPFLEYIVCFYNFQSLHKLPLLWERPPSSSSPGLLSSSSRLNSNIISSLISLIYPNKLISLTSGFPTAFGL